MTFSITSADFRERTRRFSFFALLGLALVAAFIFVPNQNASFSTMLIDTATYAQASNPTWIPLAAAICTGMFLPLFGFVYLKGAIETDRNTGVLSLLQTSGTPRIAIVFGKFFSNCLILFALTGIVAVGSALMILLRFPGQWLSFWSLLSPFIAILPGLIFTAAIAVLFETIPFLRTKTGSVFGILAFCSLFVVIVSTTTMSDAFMLRAFDFSGYTWLVDSIYAATGNSSAHITVLGGGAWISQGGTKELVFSGIPITSAHLAEKGVLLGISCIIVCLSAVLLEKRPLKIHEKKQEKQYAPAHSISAPKQAQNLSWKPVPTGNFSLPRQSLTEVKRIASDVPLFLIFALLGMFIACAFSPFEVSLTVLLPITYGLALLPLSKLGTAENACGMDALLCTIDGGAMRQIVASSIAGTAFSLLLCAPVLLRALAMGKLLSAAALFLFAICVPLAAETLGRTTKTTRTFQILLIILLFIMLNAPGVILPL